MELACLCEPFLFQHLCYVLSIHKYVGDGAAVDILAMGHDTDGAFFKKLFQPLPGGLSAWLAQLRCVDAAESDAFRAHAQCIAVDGVDGLAGGNSSSGYPA